ncbi:MAG TPA: LamG-like jellyroll fold domain-containing protein [Candidatus Sulfotelmatobacter sp.]|nr:LamG-like jellyroll fold domain-containing protein [Candidatus Sulfotelmatobacter sp.]
MNKKLIGGLVVVSAVLVLATMRMQAQSPYSQAITSLGPVGYWPMHEVESGAQGDTETNYGTLGLLGTGYYPDWAGSSVGFKRGAPGALANDPDTAVSFTSGSSPSAGTYTDFLFVPHTSPLSTFNPPFSIECWFYPTNLQSKDIWAQCGDEGLNFGGISGDNGGNLAGLRFVWMDGTNTGFQIYNLEGVQYSAGFVGNSSGAQAYPTNHWYHLVVTCDANTNFTVWVNGAQQSFNPTYGTQMGPGTYAPDYWTPITIGGGRGGTRAVAGTVDEFAVYPTVITDIYQHYTDGTTESQPGVYVNDVLNDHPLIYLRMDAAPTYTSPNPGTWPALVNDGTTNGVAVGNGVYTPGTDPGLVTAAPVNPNGITFGGVSANLVPLNGVSSFANAGSSPAYNPTGSNANFAVTALFRGYPCDNRNQSIVGHGTNSWQLGINTNGCLVFNAGNGNTPAGGIGQAPGDLKTIGVYNDGYWHQVVAIDQTNMISIYVDGLLDTNGTPAGITPTNLIPGNTANVMIGSDPNFTNNPAGVGRSFAGQICEVAFFTNALTAAQVQTIYSNCEVAAYITTQPPTNGSLDAGASTYTNFNVLAKGAPTLAYQWYFNTSSNYSGATKLANNTHYANATTTQLTVTNLTANDTGYYFVVVTNNYGSATSILASLTVFGPPSIISQTPVPYTNSFTLFAGSSPDFSITAVGAQPIIYRWFTNGVLDAAAASSNMVWANVQIGSITNYCILSNIVGSITSSVWSASVVAAPTAPYPAAVLANSPIAYWRLNESDNGAGNDGAICHDYVGGNDGVYTNVYLAQPGYGMDDPETSAAFGYFGVTTPTINNYAGQIRGIDFVATNANAEFTVEAWVNADGSGFYVPDANSPVITKGIYGKDDEFNLGVNSASTEYSFYVRSAAGTTYTVASAAATLDGNWHHIAGVCDEANGLLSLYYDGKLESTTTIPTNSGVYEAPEPASIGAGTDDGIDYTNQFVGYVNDVAVYNYALSAAQVEAQYTAPGVAPFFTQAPANSYLINAGGTLTIPAIAVGTVPVTYQWADVNGGTNVVTGSTNGLPLNATLIVTNVPVAWNDDQLELTVNNAYGSTNVYVTLLVNTNIPTIALTLNLPSPVTVVSGKSYIYSIGATGPTPFSYQWYNGVTPISGATNSAYTATAGSPGSTTYFVIVTNSEGSVTSTISTFISINPPPAPTFAYATNLLELNPAGYWPMHETEAAAQGDVEVNYGSLGPLGDGFYPDWAGTAGGFIRGYPGPLTNDATPCVNFIHADTSSPVEYTNGVFVAHSSPLTTLTPPFSVECWLQPTNKPSTGVYAWGQFGYDILNGPGALSGSPSGYGITLNFNGTASFLGLYNGPDQQNPDSGSMTTDAWYYAVVTCDAATNTQLYLNGNTTNSATSEVGKYLQDYWTPLTIGFSRSGGRSFAGYIADFAVYTNVISTNVILAHYNDGISGNPGQYFTDVRSANPVIYLRMDASNYLAPATNFWPTLFNYGSAGINGLYTPGTIPGILPGPITNTSGASLNGLSGNVSMLSGVSSFADAGYAPAFNPTGSNADFSVTAWFRGNPCDNRTQAIAGHGTNSWELNVTTNGCVVFNAGNGNHAAGGTGHAVGDFTTRGVYNDGNWHQVVAVNQADLISIYVDGALDTNGTPTGITPTSVIEGNSHDVMIGSDPIYTNYPAGVGENFAGQICDVAFFTNALNAGEVSALYAAAVNPSQVPAYVAPEPPLSATVAPGGTLSLTAGAAGTSNVGYQWQFTTNGGGTDVLKTGAGSSPLNANLTVSSVPAAWNGGQLELTVTNAYGANSTFVALSVVNLLPTTPTNIVVTVTNNDLYLTWPSNYTGYQLQAQTNSVTVGISTNWVNVTGSTSTNQVVFPINITNGTVFYRLVYP